MIVRRIKRRLRKLLGNAAARPCILMYHRVAALKQDPWALAVTPERFEEQIRYIHRHRLPMSVDEMVERLRRGNLPQKAIALTFDDAYRDNLVHAKPVLARYAVPATVFVPTGYVGKQLPFWWDELANMVLACPEPQHLIQRCAGDEVELNWGAVEPGDSSDTWRGWDPPESQRQASYIALWTRMQRTSKEEREGVMEELRAKLQAEVDSLALPMTEADLSRLVEGGIMRLGAHTVNHASLSDLSLEESREEIRNSQRQCRAFTQEPVEGFAYPYGNMTPEVCQEVRAAGFSWACSTEGEFLDGEQPDFFMLPRLTVTDIAGREFAMTLAG